MSLIVWLLFFSRSYLMFCAIHLFKFPIFVDPVAVWYQHLFSITSTLSM